MKFRLSFYNEDWEHDLKKAAEESLADVIGELTVKEAGLVIAARAAMFKKIVQEFTVGDGFVMLEFSTVEKSVLVNPETKK